MQAILVLKIQNFEQLIQSRGIAEAVDMVYDLRNFASARLGAQVTSIYQDTVVAILPTVQNALSDAKHILNLLCMQNTLGPISNGIQCIPVGASIGYGDLYQTVDGSYWGKELTHAISLVNTSQPNEISLTNTAKTQITQVVSTTCSL